MKHITTICFDLDDTLWDMPSAIRHAEKSVYSWLSQNSPEIASAYSMKDLRHLREQIDGKHPDSRHDLRMLRVETYRAAARSVGSDPELAIEACEVFQKARNQVTLYDDVIPVLDALSLTHRLVALSNGNADLGVIGLASYFSRMYSAENLGAAKPDPGVFYAICERSDCHPAEMLHVGDHPENDVVAPSKIGMQAVWLNRKGKLWPEEFGPPEQEIRNLSELLELFGNE